MMRPDGRKQRGVALLVVLILLVMMSALAAKISQQFCRNLQKTRYQVSQQQLRWAIHSQLATLESLLQSQARGEGKGLSPEGEWRKPLETKGETWTVVSQIEDAQACFNLNSLAAEEKTPPATDAAALPAKPAKEQIVEQLLADSGLGAIEAETVYQQLVDYLDADDLTAKERQESDAWSGGQPARLPANQIMRTPGELRLLPAFPAAAWAKASKLFCVLPDISAAVDVNTLTPKQAPLLSALFLGTLSEDDATRLLASRPEAGWDSVEALSKTLEANFPQTKEKLAEVQPFLAVNSRYFRVNSTGSTDDLTLRVVSELQMDGDAGGIVTWQRRYRMME